LNEDYKYKIICLIKNDCICYLWGLGIGDWGLGQSPIPNPQSPKIIIKYFIKYIAIYIINIINFK